MRAARRRLTSVDAVQHSCHTPTLLQRYTARDDRRAAAAMDDAKRRRKCIKNSQKYADESPLQTLRLIEWSCCFLAWTLLASAHRSKFDGLYEYQNYTPLTFLLSGLVMDFLKLPALYVAEHGFRVDQALLRKVELYGSMYMTAWLGIGFIAAASASSVLHDEFGGASTCGPSNGTHQQKRKASYFCARVDAAISFAFFAFHRRLFLVVGTGGGRLKREDEEANRSIMATRRRSKTRTAGPSSRRRSAAWTRSPGMVMGWGRWTCKCVDDDEPRVDGVCGSVNAARALRLRAGFAASVFCMAFA